MITIEAVERGEFPLLHCAECDWQWNLHPRTVTHAFVIPPDIRHACTRPDWNEHISTPVEHDKLGGGIEITVWGCRCGREDCTWQMNTDADRGTFRLENFQPENRIIWAASR